ncbi:uncharacterized protein [Rutidosis leptorrhynchoides]|uniref:uncharacterized protein n=1 Tax=Rutidosis leptorrhynchoides TaxID=125765 RepID=UPI003A9976ED
MLPSLTSPSSPLILRCILRRPPPFTTTTTHISTITPSFPKLFKSTLYYHLSSISIPTPPLPLHKSHSPFSFIPRSLSTTENDVASDNEIDNNPPIEPEPEIENPVDARLASAHKEMMSKLKGMSVKEKKELGSYANSLGKKLKSQQVGKSGVTDSVAIALVETLEANELLKLKIHNNCPGELDDVVAQLEEATGSVVVGRIGRSIIIYRPSLTKLKAEEKKKQAMKIFLKRKAAFKASYQGRMQRRGQSSALPDRKPYQRSRSSSSSG